MGQTDFGKAAANAFLSGAKNPDKTNQEKVNSTAEIDTTKTVNSTEEIPKADSIAGNNKIEDTEIKVEPRRRGRRPKAVKYNAKILLTVTPEMRDKIFAFSDEVGMSVVEMLREAITDWMDAKSKNKE